VESAAVLSIAFLLVFGVFEYGRFMMVKNVMENAAREGARYAVVQSTTTQATTLTQSQIITYTQNKMGAVWNQFNPPPTIVVTAQDPNTGADTGTWDTASFTNPIAVRITATYKPLTYVISGNIPLQAQSSMGSEAN
jgi:Flp pilus assembly protein TadG